MVTQSFLFSLPPPCHHEGAQATITFQELSPEDSMVVVHVRGAGVRWERFFREGVLEEEEQEEEEKGKKERE